MKTYLSSEISCRFGDQNRSSLIPDLASLTMTINDVVKNMSMSCLVVSSLNDISSKGANGLSVELSDINGGTVAIVSSFIGGTNQERVGYSWKKDSDTSPYGHWEAFSGNVRAENIYFTDGFQFAGNYTLGLKKTSNATTVKYDNETSLQSMMTEMFTNELSIDKPSPSTSITASTSASRYEVGTAVTPSFDIACDGKTYTYGSNTNKALGSTTGLTSNQYSISYSLNGSAQSKITGDWSGLTSKKGIVGNNYTVVEGEKSIDASVSSTFILPDADDYVPYTNLQKNLDYPHKVTDSSATSTTSSRKVTGYYRAFYTWRTEALSYLPVEGDPDLTKVTSATIRGFGPNSPEVESKAGTFTMTSKRAIQWVFAYQKGTVTSIKINDTTGAQALGVRGPYSIKVNDAGGNAVDYSLFYTTLPIAESGTNTYSIVASK